MSPMMSPAEAFARENVDLVDLPVFMNSAKSATQRSLFRCPSNRRSCSHLPSRSIPPRAVRGGQFRVFSGELAEDRPGFGDILADSPIHHLPAVYLFGVGKIPIDKARSIGSQSTLLTLLGMLKSLFCRCRHVDDGRVAFSFAAGTCRTLSCFPSRLGTHHGSSPASP